MDKKIEPPALQPEMAEILAVLDFVREGLLKGHITELGIIAINTDGQQMGSSVSLYPRPMHPLVGLGLSEAFRMGVISNVYTPLNLPVNIPAKLN